MDAQLKTVAARVARGLGPEDAAALRLIDLAALVARADGVIDDAEKAALTSFIEELLGTSMSKVVVAQLIAERIDAASNGNVAAQCEAIGKTLANADVATDGLELAVRIALASGGLGPEEKDVIWAVAKAAGITPEHVAMLIARVSRASLTPPPGGLR